MQGRYREDIGKFYGELPVDSLKKACALGKIRRGAQKFSSFELPF
jgi:hypothetical protein